MLHSVPTEQGKYHKSETTFWGAFDIERNTRIECNKLLSYASYVAGETKPPPPGEGITSKQ
jgi:hypothetical protein